MLNCSGAHVQHFCVVYDWAVPDVVNEVVRNTWRLPSILVSCLWSYANAVMSTEFSDKKLQISLAFLLRFDALDYSRLLCKNSLTSFVTKFC